MTITDLVQHDLYDNVFFPGRQSYNVNLEVRVEGTNTVSTNSLDLKNPYFRYTGVAPSPPPGNNSVSPSESYWSTVDAQGAKQGGCCGPLFSGSGV